MDFKQSKRNKKRETWITIGLLISLFIGVNFMISKIHSLFIASVSFHTLPINRKYPQLESWEVFSHFQIRLKGKKEKIITYYFLLEF